MKIGKNRMSFLSGIIYHFSARFSLQGLGQGGDILYPCRGSVLCYVYLGRLYAAAANSTSSLYV